MVSRFAVLTVDDDNDSPTKNKPVSKNQKKKLEEKQIQKESLNKKKSKKKSQAKTEADELQYMAFGGSRPRKSKNQNQHGGSKAANGPQSQGWEDWKKRDAEFVSDTYEQDLQEAILLSKIDFEEKKEVYDQSHTETEEVKKGKKSNQKKNKSSTMTLNEFKNLYPSQTDHPDSRVDTPSDAGDASIVAKPNPEDRTFFEKIEEDTKKFIDRDRRLESYKAREPNIAESARVAQFQEELERKDQEIEQFKEDIQKLKEKLTLVKSRNKQLCSILGQAEMRDKAEVLVEVEKLQRVKDELTEEVKQLHGHLEQERSKVHSLTLELKRSQGNKKRMSSENT